MLDRDVTPKQLWMPGIGILVESKLKRLSRVVPLDDPRESWAVVVKSAELAAAAHWG